MRGAFRGSAALAGLLLTGCGAFGTEPAPPCPPVAVLRDAAELIRFRPGEGRDLTDVVDHARFARYATECDYDDDGVTVDLVLDIAVEKGPAATDSAARVPYFIAVVDADGNILAKEVFTSVVEIPQGRRFAVVREETEQFLPLAAPSERRRYEILVGFQLTREELEENRRRRG